MVINIPLGNSTTSPKIIYLTLFVLTIVAVTVHFKPFVYRLNMALKPASSPEAITKAELIQNVKDPLPKPKPPSERERLEAALDETAGILAELAGKKNEINELIRYYQNGINELEEQLFGIKGAANKLRKFMWWFLRCMERDPLNAKIVFLFLKTSANFMDTDVYANVKTFYSYLVKIFEEGGESGELKPGLNPYVARSIFVGTIDHIITRWLLRNMSYSLFDNLEHTFELLMDAFLPHGAKEADDGRHIAENERTPNRS